jgi:hypothetical protein
MQTQNLETLKAYKTNVNHLLDEVNKVCAKCKDRESVGCEGCSTDKRKKNLLSRKEGIMAAIAEK